MVVVPGGRFQMGSGEGEPDARPSEMPIHSEAIGPFAVSEREITIAEWRMCVAAGACPTTAGLREGDPRAPISLVSWDDTQTYVAWLSKMTGERYRLLTEPEWEYAARAPLSETAHSRYSWGDNAPVCDVSSPSGAAFHECGIGSPLPSGSFRANRFGLYDMQGNVFEWTQDCFARYGAKTVPASTKCDRVVRGGAWDFHAEDIRAAFRLGLYQGVRMSIVGVRVARSIRSN
jgi:formylglycine-generating enzyme required for sulfatase activity